MNPTREQFKALYGLSISEPFGMLNLLKFREHALYQTTDPEFVSCRISGRDAYENYSTEAAAIFRKVGGHQHWIGRPRATLIGPEDETWDIAFIANYPSLRAFIELVKSSAYQAATRHRTAALSDSRLLVCSRLPVGHSFAPISYLDFV